MGQGSCGVGGEQYHCHVIGQRLPRAAHGIGDLGDEHSGSCQRESLDAHCFAERDDSAHHPTTGEQDEFRNSYAFAIKRMAITRP